MSSHRQGLSHRIPGCVHPECKGLECQRGRHPVGARMNPTDPTPAMLERLEELARTLREDNPTLPVYIDNGAVWISHDGTDFGIYSATIDGRVVCTVHQGLTVLHRPSKPTISTTTP